MKKRIAIPLVCLCVALLLAGGLALLNDSGLSLADTLGMLLEKPFEGRGEEMEHEVSGKPSEDTYEDWNEESVDEDWYDGSEQYRGDVPEWVFTDGENRVFYSPGTQHTHIFEGSHYCSQCWAYADMNRDGSYTVIERKPYAQIECDANGNAVVWVTYEHVSYYENGDDKLTYEYRNGRLSCESHYSVYDINDPGPVIYEKKEIVYPEEGGMILRFYDPRHDQLNTSEYYDEEGTLIKTERHSYEFDGRGHIMKEEIYVNDVLYYVVERFTDPNTYDHKDYEIYYAEDGITPERIYTYSYECDEEDFVTCMTVKLNGMPHLDAYYTHHPSGPSFCYREVSYDENGQMADDIYLNRFGLPIDP